MELMIAALFVILGFISLLKPIVFLYLLFSLPILSAIPTLTTEESQFKIAQLGSASIYAVDLIIALLPLVLSIIIIKKIWLRQKPIKWIFDSPVSKAILMMFIWDIFISFLSIRKGFGVPNVMRKLSIESLMFVAILVPLLNIENAKEKVLNFSVVLALLLSGFAFVKYFILQEMEYTSSGTVRTLLGNDVVILLFPFCYILFYSKIWINKKVLSIGIIMIITVGIHLAGHRSGYLALLFIIVSYYFISIKEKLKYLWVPAFGLFILGILLFIPLVINIGPDRGLAQDVIVRFQDTFDSKNKTTQERLDLWKYAEVVMLEKPIIGYGRFPAYSLEFEQNPEVRTASIEGIGEIRGPAHNFIVSRFLHQGLIGVSILFCFIFIILKQGFELSKINPGYAGFLITYVLSFFLFSLFNTSFTSYSAIFLYAAVGFLNLEILNARNMR